MAAVGYAIIFTFDLMLPLGVAGGVPYVAVVLLGMWLPQPSQIYLLAAVSSVLTVLGFYFSPEGGILWVVLANRGLALFAIWVSAFLILVAKRSRRDYIDLRQSQELLRKSELQFRNLFENANVGMAVIDTDGRRQQVNSAFCEMLGYSAEELTGQSAFVTTHPDDREESERFLKDFASGKAQHFKREKRYIHKDGSTVWTLLTASAIQYIDGKPSLGVTQSQDITERKRAEDALRKSEESLRGAIESLQEGFVLFDADDRIVMGNDVYRRINPKAQEFLDRGMRFEDLIRANVERDWMVEARGREEEFIRERVERHRNPGPPITRQFGDGKWYILKETRTPEGGTALTFIDITERKQAEEALRESEERYAFAVTGTNDGIWDWDIQTGEDYLSPRWKEILGYQDHELDNILETFTDALHPDDTERVMEAVRAHLDERTPYDIDCRLHHKDGHYIWVRAKGQAVWDEHGNPMRMGGSISDITAEKHSEEALRESEARFRSIIDSSPMPISLKDLEQKYVVMNKAFEDMFEISADQAIGRTATVFARNESVEIGEAHEHRVIETGETSSKERNTVLPSGKRVLGISTKFPIKNADGQITLVGAIMTDISEVKQTEEQLRQALKMEAVGQLTSGLAHDFNNLLTAVLTNLELLSERLPVDAGLKNFAKAATSAVHRGSDLTYRLLAFSRQQTLDPTSVDLNVMATEMKNLLSLTLGDETEVVISENTNLQPCMADLSQMENALLNLAINARDAMPTGGTLTVESANVTFDKDYAEQFTDVTPGDYVMLSVSDTGTGMAPEVIEQAFDPFFTTKDVGEGSGLGLSMVHGFVKQSNGHIEIDSEVGRGTTVKLFFPKTTEAERKIEIDDVPEEGLRGEGTILVVEDDTDVRSATSLLLGDLGFRRLEAKDGPTALAKLEEGSDVDLIFTDLRMPGGVSGVELAKQVRERYPKIKVLLCSGYVGGASLSVDGSGDELPFIAKPYTKSELGLAIKKALGRAS